MPYETPVGLFGVAPTGAFGEAFHGVANNFAAAAQQRQQAQDAEFNQMLDIANAAGALQAQQRSQLQFQRAEEERKKKLAAVQQLGQGLDPQSAALMQAAPDQFFAQAAEAAFAQPEAPNPQNRYKEVDGVLVDLMAEGGPRPVPGATGAGGGMPKPKPTEIAGLRKEYANESAPYAEIRNRFKNIVSAKNDSTGDIARVFSFVKMLDTISTVSPTEAEALKQAGGIYEQATSLYNHLAAGGGMSAEKREQIKAQAAEIYRSRYEDQVGRFQAYQGIAERFGMRPDDVLSGIEVTPLEELLPKQTKQQAAAAPAAKDVSQLSDADLDAMTIDQLQAMLDRTANKPRNTDQPTRTPGYVGAIPPRDGQPQIAPGRSGMR